MGRNFRPILVTIFVVFGGCTGFLIFDAEIAQAPPTYIGGSIFDGSGGPLTLAGSPYIVIDDLTIPMGEVLTIQPGVQVRFDDYYSFYVNGTLMAIGTEANPINITSNKTTPASSDWRSIFVESTGRVEMNHCNISFSEMGIWIYFSSYSNITNSTLFSSLSGIYLWGSSNVTILNNTISSHEFGIYLTSSSNVTISKNTFIDDGILIDGRQLQHFNSHIIPNTNTVNNKPLSYYRDCSGLDIDGISIGQLILANCNDVKITNLSINDTDVAIEVANSTYIDIIDNEISSTTWGIFLTGASISNITNNTLTDVDGPGLYVWESSVINITGNDLSNNSFAFFISKSDRNLILGNNITRSEFNGIHLYRSSNNTILRNHLSGNWEGLSIFDLSNNNSITENMIAQNNRGISIEIWFDQSSGNRIFHNNIIDNQFQAYDDMFNNFWNDTYPSGGNYWGDYSPICPDEFNGAITPQTTGSSDGICDNLYPIDFDSQDYYPLTQPFPKVAPPTNLSAELTGANQENVTISWDASLEDPGNVTSYSVYYGNVYDTNGTTYDFLMEFPASGSSRYHLTVQSIGDGNPDNYFFYVQANTSVSFGMNDTQVAKFTEMMETGKHLVSIPLELNDTSISSAFQTLEYNSIWYYSPYDVLDPWKSYNPQRPLNDLTNVNHTMGLWLSVSIPGNLTIAGTIPKTTAILLKEGWNLVGYPSFIERNVSEALSGIAYERIEGYSPSPPEYLGIYSGDDMMRSGYGYWIKISSDTLWTVSN
jgi:parallel beta-helix repeat protein